jgi:hypothetical protein
LYFSEVHANHAINFIQQLKLTKGRWAGQPFILLPWERDLVSKLLRLHHIRGCDFCVCLFGNSASAFFFVCQTLLLSHFPLPSHAQKKMNSVPDLLRGLNIIAEETAGRAIPGFVKVRGKHNDSLLGGS